MVLPARGLQAVENTSQMQKLVKVGVYPGAKDFTLYQDDDETYAYEKGTSSITTLHWDDTAGKLTSENGLLEVVGR
jgi:alpha-D-xyloside xylohydrolase